ncbi:alpha/beta fold hydrolase [Microbacterium dauci]|uniref:Alpha/beta hydrolase family protein n=1 Tax=Microbacterium dauci TaxID=3048008 RepID=A0ABT6ZD98_9MICO|nr:alpha/beta hydrolase family protein [Microbacterium sp. LX3-4]MDJ1114128.1 alpha/beta hydrolase family protein [Microbacterium sp. LX3-4]
MARAHEPTDVTVDHVEVHGARTRITHVESIAEGSPPSFILVAGVGVAASYFEFLAPILARHGQVFALDLPGFAGMPRPDDQPTAAYFADHVEAVIEKFALENPVLIGHSMGTQIVTEVLHRRTELSHGVLVSPVVNDREAAPQKVALRFGQSATKESMHVALMALSAYLLCGVVYFLTVLPHLLRYRLVDRIADVEASILLIRGEFDTTSPRRFHSRLVDAASRSRRWEILGASHSIINGHAVGVADLVLRHIGDELPQRGQLTSEEASVPPARHSDVAMVWNAAMTRAAEWFSALRGDERGVARAKLAHARILWRAYSPGRSAG